jgi:hypothetical protein
MVAEGMKEKIKTEEKCRYYERLDKLGSMTSRPHSRSHKSESN